MIDENIERYRISLLETDEKLPPSELGAGKKKAQIKSQFIKKIARKSLSAPKYCGLYANLAYQLGAKTLFELGTCLGVNTCYLASKNPEAQIVTFEGHVPYIKIAQKGADTLGLTHINFVEGNIDTTFEEQLAKQAQLDFLFIDANHTYEATMRYFKTALPKIHDQSCMVFDDIYWSKEMTRAWTEIKQHARVIISIDLYRCGIILFNPKNQSGHYKFRF